MKVAVSQQVPREWNPDRMAAILRSIETQMGLHAEGRLAGRYTAATAAPTTGDWAKGDIVDNSSPSVVTSAASDYVIVGWICTVSGSPGTWKERRVLVEDITPTGAATQAEQEAATSTTVYTSPGMQHFHPSSAKAYCKFNGTGTVALGDSFNVSSITDNGVGDYTINFSVTMSSANYAGFVMSWVALVAGGRRSFDPDIKSKATTSLRIETQNDTGAAEDHPEVVAVIFVDI
jgi:hypothetical protein